MNMKNTVILLILLLSILGLIIGVHYTTDESSDVNQGKEITIDGNNPTIIIHLEKKENDTSLIDRISNLKIE